MRALSAWSGMPLTPRALINSIAARAAAWCSSTASSPVVTLRMMATASSSVGAWTARAARNRASMAGSALTISPNRRASAISLSSSARKSGTSSTPNSAARRSMSAILPIVCSMPAPRLPRLARSSIATRAAARCSSTSSKALRMAATAASSVSAAIAASAAAETAAISMPSSSSSSAWAWAPACARASCSRWNSRNSSS
mmetsp:Transcript_19705/g.58619  ORF Transcript_19705/g.58619 Transcript_19705/m.58619 type:complete len:200 (-) Transcript_19705:1245-1844(-)